MEVVEYTARTRRPDWEKMRRHAYRVTDENVEALLQHGLDEDAIFELAIACAVGESHARLLAGLRLQALGPEG